MVKSILGQYHAGLRDWVIQRVSAVVMAVYVLMTIVFFMLHPGLTYGEWHAWFSLTFVKIASWITLLFLLMHAWVGMWTIFTDYVKPFAIRLILNALVMLMLIACFFWGLMILWSI